MSRWESQKAARPGSVDVEKLNRENKNQNLKNMLYVKYIYLIALSTIIVSSCSSHRVKVQSRLNKQASAYLQERIVELNNGITVDSMVFVRIDTITDYDLILGEKKIFYDELSTNSEDTEQKVKEMKAKNKRVKLYRDIGSKYAEDEREELLEMSAEVKKMTDKTMDIIKQIDTLDAELSRCDSITPRYFVAMYFIQLRAKDQSVKKDTLPIYLNLDKNIVHPEDVKRKR